jgi:hypothetical protein
MMMKSRSAWASAEIENPARERRRGGGEKVGTTGARTMP